MNADSQCAICQKEIHSISTRRMGDHYLCIDCGDTLHPFLDAYANSLVIESQSRIKAERKNNSEIILSEIYDYFAGCNVHVEK